MTEKKHRGAQQEPAGCTQHGGVCVLPLRPSRTPYACTDVLAKGAAPNAMRTLHVDARCSGAPLN